MHLCKKEIVKPPRCWGYHLRLFFSHESKKNNQLVFKGHSHTQTRTLAHKFESQKSPTATLSVFGAAGGCFDTLRKKQVE